MEQTRFQIEEVAFRTGLTKRALRYYEDLELIDPVRTEAGYRLYSENDIENILRIKEIKESLGFCLSEIKDMLELEKSFKEVLNGNCTNEALIEKSINEVKKQLLQIKNKEESLKRLKSKCYEVLSRLESLNNAGRGK